MTEFTTSYLAELTAGLTAEVVKALSAQAKQALLGTEKERALQRCLQAGIAALLAQASTVSQDERHLLDDIFRDFFRHPFTARALC